MNGIVSVIGTIFMDCKGFAAQRYNPDGRNLGSIEFVHGGVGRNVAENLAGLELTVNFVSSVDTTALGKAIVERLVDRGAQVDDLLHATHEGMGMWLAILDENGNLAGSISQMPDMALLEQLISSRGSHIVSRSSHIVLELDLTERISRAVIDYSRKEGKPVYGIPGNLDVVLKHRDLLQDIDCFICNHFEAERLLENGFSQLDNERMLEALIGFVNSAGLRSMVVTLGAGGSLYYDSRTGESGHQPVFPVRLVDSSGAGDAFFSGTVMGLTRGLPLRDAVICGTKVAGWTIESSENNCPDLSRRMRSDRTMSQLLAL